MSDQAGYYPITLRRGSVWVLPLGWVDSNDNPVDVTGYSAELRVRRGFDGPGVLFLSTDDGITLGGAAGTIVLERTAVQTAELPRIPRFANALYDLVMIPPSGEDNKLALLHGPFVVMNRVEPEDTP